MLNALVSRDPNDNDLPQFNPEETETFGQRAAYVTQRRSPWDNRTRQDQELRSRIAHDRIYNHARGGLPICTTCTANGSNNTQGHTTNTPSCPYFVPVDPYRQRFRTTAEIISDHAAVERALFEGNY